MLHSIQTMYGVINTGVLRESLMILCVKHVSAIFTIARSLCVRCEIMSTVLIELQEVPTPVIAITKITMQCWGAFNSFPHVYTTVSSWTIPSVALYKHVLYWWFPVNRGSTVACVQHYLKASQRYCLAHICTFFSTVCIIGNTYYMSAHKAIMM